MPQITAPADPLQNCTSRNAIFAAGTVIPLTQGAFDKTATVPIGDPPRALHIPHPALQGQLGPEHHRFKGFTTIRKPNGSCNTGPKYWRMKRVSPN